MSLPSIYPPPVAVASINAARKPLYGGEIAVFGSPEPTYELATHIVHSANSGETDIDAGYALAVLADPRDLVVMLTGKAIVDATTTVVLTLVGTDAASGALTGTATFDVPAWRDLPERSFAPGFAVRVVVAAGKVWKTLTSVRSNAPIDVLAGTYKFVVLATPDVGSFELIGCTTEAGFNSVVRPGKTIMCGMEEKFTKRGRAPAGELTISAKNKDQFSGLRRLEGVDSATVVLQPLKDDMVAAEHLLFTGVILTASTKAGDGEDESSISGAAQYERFAVIPALDA